MSDKNFMALIAIIIVAVVGAIFLFGGDNSSGQAFIGDPLEVATGEGEEGEEVQPADHVKGPADARVTLIEFADFGCPACFGFFPQLQTLEAQYPDDLRIVYRHNPLTALHPNAFAAHRASVAAANQDMFWEMHDLLLERQPSWSAQQSGLTVSQAAEVFEGYAQELGLDMERYAADVESEEVFNYIDSHLDSGNQLGVTGTPTVFLNGEEITERTAAEISVLIDQILAESTPSDDASDGESNAEESDGNSDDSEVESTEESNEQ